MQFLLPLASILGIEVDELMDRLKKNAIAWSAVALFGIIGLAFILVAIGNAAVLAWGPVVGPLIVGAGAIIIAVVIWGVMAVLDSMAKRRAVERRHSQEKTALVTTAALTALPIVLQSPLMRKVGIPVGGALAAAFLLSKSSRHKSGDELID
jgi:membrane protein implicated in regulation of membrane protease activity